MIQWYDPFFHGNILMTNIVTKMNKHLVPVRIFQLVEHNTHCFLRSVVSDRWYDSDAVINQLKNWNMSIQPHLELHNCTLKTLVVQDTLVIALEYYSAEVEDLQLILCMDTDMSPTNGVIVYSPKCVLDGFDVLWGSCAGFFDIEIGHIDWSMDLTHRNN